MHPDRCPSPQADPYCYDTAAMSLARPRPCTTSNGFASTPTRSTAGWSGAGLPPSGEGLIAIDERRRAAIRAPNGAGATQRGVEGDRRGQGKKDEATGEALMAEVAQLKAIDSGWKPKQKAAERR